MPFLKGVKNKKQLPIATPIKDKETLQLIEKCYNELIETSKVIAAERNIHYTNVISVEALRQMSREMPMTEEDMLAIPHVTRAVYEKYGKRFLDVTTRYAAERCGMHFLLFLLFMCLFHPSFSLLFIKKISYIF